MKTRKHRETCVKPPGNTSNAKWFSYAEIRDFEPSFNADEIKFIIVTFCVSKKSNGRLRFSAIELADDSWKVNTRGSVENNKQYTWHIHSDYYSPGTISIYRIQCISILHINPKQYLTLRFILRRFLNWIVFFWRYPKATEALITTHVWDFLPTTVFGWVHFLCNFISFPSDVQLLE